MHLRQIAETQGSGRAGLLFLRCGWEEGRRPHGHAGVRQRSHCQQVRSITKTQAAQQLLPSALSATAAIPPTTSAVSPVTQSRVCKNRCLKAPKCSNSYIPWGCTPPSPCLPPHNWGKPGCAMSSSKSPVWSHHRFAWLWGPGEDGNGNGWGWDTNPPFLSVHELYTTMSPHSVTDSHGHVLPALCGHRQLLPATPAAPHRRVGAVPGHSRAPGATRLLFPPQIKATSVTRSHNW